MKKLNCANSYKGWTVFHNHGTALRGKMVDHRVWKYRRWLWIPGSMLSHRPGMTPSYPFASQAQARITHSLPPNL
jgi:hypothetical protein